MRYKDTGNLHMDFHGAVNTTINYIVKNFGVDAIRKIFFSTGHDVYKSIRERLAKGDTSELIEHWNYYITRENGKFRIVSNKDNVILYVDECPAVKHVKKLGLEVSPYFCEQTDYVNKGICDGTDFEIATVKTGECSCMQTLRRIKNDTK
jgi:hypothetical protein